MFLKLLFNVSVRVSLTRQLEALINVNGIISHNVKNGVRITLIVISIGSNLLLGVEICLWRNIEIPCCGSHLYTFWETRLACPLWGTCFSCHRRWRASFTCFTHSRKFVFFQVYPAKLTLPECSSDPVIFGSHFWHHVLLCSRQWVDSRRVLYTNLIYKALQSFGEYTYWNAVTKIWTLITKERLQCC